jgi:perosamine synthetase
VRVHRSLPPAASPIDAGDLCRCLPRSLRKGYSERIVSEIREVFRVKHVFPVSSGKAALTILLKALHSLTHRKEVLIPAYTCFSVPSAICKAGLRIRLCDVDPRTLDFEYEALGECVNEDTLCVVSTHLFGLPADVGRVKEMCRDKGVFLVEDAAQAMGIERNGEMLGTLGDAGFYSLGRGKNLNCAGGGILVTNSDRIAAAIEPFFREIEEEGTSGEVNTFLQAFAMTFLTHPSLYWIPEGLSFLRLGETIFHEDFPVKRLSRVSEGLLSGWKDRLSSWNKARARNASFYLKDFQKETKSNESMPYLRLPILLESKNKRDEVREQSQRRGLGIARMYPAPVSEIPEIRDRFQGLSYPGASEVAERLLTLPTHPYLNENDLREIVGQIRAVSVTPVIPGRC